MHIDRDLAREIAVGHGGGHGGDVAHLISQVAGHGIHALGEIFPRARHTAYLRLPTELAFRTHFAGHARDFRSKSVELVHHDVDGILQLLDFSAGIHRDLAREIAVGDGGSDGGDVAHLLGQVAGHGVDAIGEIFPGAADTAHLGLSAELSFGAYLAGHARDFGGESVELVHHGVNGVLELLDLAFRVDGDLGREVAFGDARGHLGNIAHLVGQVAGHQVHAVREVLPRAGYAAHLRLPAQFSFRSHLAGDARDFRGEPIELVDHGVDGVLQFENLAARRHGDLAREIATRDRGSHFGDVAHLLGQVLGHRVDAVGEILPRPADATHFRLTAQPAFGTDFAGHARDLRSKRIELVHHGVDGVLELQDFAAHVDRNLAREVAPGHGRGHLGDVAHLGREVAGHEIDAVGEVFPRAADACHDRLAAKLSFRADFAGHARHFRGERAQLIHHRVDCVLQLENLAAHIDHNLARKVAARDRGCHLGDVAHLSRQVSGHGVYAIGKVFPRAGYASHVRLAAKLSFRADFAGHAGHFGRERAELIHHGVDGVLELQNLAAHIDRDLAREIAARDRGSHFGNVAHLSRQVSGHGVYAIG